MEKGGDLNVVNDQGMTPVAYAKSTVLQYLMLENATANVNNLKNQQNFKKKLNFDNNEIYWGNQHEIKMKLQRE